ncbi:protein broad-minded [Stigmatopora nigra]
MSTGNEDHMAVLLKQFLRSTEDRLSGAPSPQSVEEVLLHLEETDKNFHNYELVKYLRQRLESTVGCVVDEELRKLSHVDGQHAINLGHDTLVHAATSRSRATTQYQEMTYNLRTTVTAAVESLVGRFDEDQLRKEESQLGRYADDCCDSESSFNRSYAFIRQEQLQVLADKLDTSQPKEVRRDALLALRHAPPSDVLSCESWTRLRQNMAAALIEPDGELSDHVLQFFAKSFSLSPLNVTREIYTSLAKSVESGFQSLNLSFPSGPGGLDINKPEISTLLKQMRLMNDFQKEVTVFWIRHPEKYMEEIIESTFSLISFRCNSPEKTLAPIHLLALLDVQASWFTKWMHGAYSRTVVLRLLEKKYKNLMQYALQECVLYRECAQSSAHSHSEERQSSSDGEGGVYSGKELQYAVVVHSLCVLGKALLYANGRKLFPIKVDSREDPISLTELVVILIDIMCHHPSPFCRDSLHADTLCPSGLVMATLCTMCERTECADQCLHQTSVIQSLMAPVIQAQGESQTEWKYPALPLVAEVLARMVNTDRGLSLFLYEENLLLGQNERTTAAHVLLRFTLRLLDCQLSATGGGDDSSRALCGAFVFVCGQMCNTCEGLQVLRGYNLHKALAANWKKTRAFSEEISMPLPEKNPPTSTQELQQLLLWEETLLDSLLNFAATPKGVLLLQQTGTIQECISHMFSRLSKKMQVSRYEKSGYGVMVAQLAATATGAAALRRSGFVQAMVVELWSALEYGSEDARAVRPKPTPTEPIERNCLKSFLSLVNLLSSSLSVWQLVAGQPLANKSEYTLREVPSSVPDLIDRLIAVNSFDKIHSLFHYEQSHAFGLRLLSVLCSSLDSLLLLESQYSICSTLLQSQRDNVPDGDAAAGNVIIDSLSVERNHVLVRVGLIGGPSERRLPPRDLRQGDDSYPWPMFWSFPPPSCYNLDPPTVQENPLETEMMNFLTSSENIITEDNWIENCRRLYRQITTGGHHGLKITVLADLLEKVVLHLSKCSTESFFSPPDYNKEMCVDDVELSPVEILGMDVCLRYGISLKLLPQEASGHLTLLMRHVKNFLSRRRVSTSSGHTMNQDEYPGHDWLTSTVFLIMSGDWQRSLRVLRNLSSLVTSALIWPASIHNSVDFSGISPLYWSTAHYVEMLLKMELQLVHAAFKMSGFTPSQMCIHWLTQCFWNFLDWPEIYHYVCICTLMGADYQVYACLAIFKHLQPQLLEQTQARQLQIFLKEEPIRGFRFCDYLEYMELLEKRYRSLVLLDLKTIYQPM